MSEQRTFYLLTSFSYCRKKLSRLKLGTKKQVAEKMDFTESQKDMTRAYHGGATGVLASGVVWLSAGLIGTYSSLFNSVVAFLIGGMFIFPMSLVLSKLLGATGKHAATNVLGKLAIESLGILFGGLFIAVVVAQLNGSLFYPIMLVMIGARYLTFQTLYGLKVYWGLAGVLMISGFYLAIFPSIFTLAGFVGGLIEIAFALIIYKRSKDLPG